MGKLNQITTCSPLEWEDAQRLIEHLKKSGEYKWALLVGLGIYLGIRISDILSLKFNQLFNKEILDLREKKTGKNRRIYLNKNLQELVAFVHGKLKEENASKVNPDLPIFLNRYGTRTICVQYINRTLPKFLKEINISCSHFATHSLRKAFGKKVYESGNKSEHSLIMLSELLHHSTIQSTRQYIGITQKDYQQAYMGL